MIKEEFILMINKELTNLEKDFREKIKILNDNPNRSEDVHYQLNLIERKISSLRRLVDLPVYARIQAMSDVEIEDYKQGKIGELELKIRKIQAMKAEEVKEQLNSELKGNHDLAKTMEFYKEIVDPSIELKASSVATDTEKAQQMATLLALYKGLSDDLNRIKCTVDLGSELPEELQTRLVVFYDSKSNELQYPDKALETVQEFEENFKR